MGGRGEGRGCRRFDKPSILFLRDFSQHIKVLGRGARHAQSNSQSAAETQRPKCIALDKRLSCFLPPHACAQSAAAFCDEAEDKWRFSTPLRRFSNLPATSSLLKEKFICRHKSNLHGEADVAAARRGGERKGWLRARRFRRISSANPSSLGNAFLRAAIWPS